MSYQANPGMSVAGGNRNVKNIPIGADGRDWSNGFCGCLSEPGTCLTATCCPCITYGRLKHRHAHLNQQGTPDPEHGGCCTGDCMIHGVLTSCGFGWILQMMLRGEIRSRYNISGGACGDCLAAACCMPCQLTQESREIELEEQSFGKY
ncbi:PLAC8-domain-containing protein [Crepidotus variabilis]|uniref:PLAC8-domain-containing protein n=1 Tax=Crepidotus variabilis TaxID=179855 RepID=A0A9P6E8C3_9AGAR|nr:PLAC8-domain-containing protein [Crepidotus variabilis]